MVMGRGEEYTCFQNLGEGHVIRGLWFMLENTFQPSEFCYRLASFNIVTQK